MYIILSWAWIAFFLPFLHGCAISRSKDAALKSDARFNNYTKLSRMVDGDPETCDPAMLDVKNQYFVMLDGDYVVSSFCMHFHYYNETGSIIVKIKKEKDEYRFNSQYTISSDKNIIKDTLDIKEINSVLIEFPSNSRSSFCLFSVEGKRIDYSKSRPVKDNENEKQYAKIYQTYYNTTRGTGFSSTSCDVNPSNQTTYYMLQLDKVYKAGVFSADVSLKQSNNNATFTVKGGVHEINKALWKIYPSTKTGMRKYFLINGSFGGDTIKYVLMQWDPQTVLSSVCFFDVEFSDVKLTNDDYNNGLYLLLVLTTISLLQSLALCNFSLILRTQMRNERVKKTTRITNSLSLKNLKILESWRKLPVKDIRESFKMDPKHKKKGEGPRTHKKGHGKRTHKRDSSLSSLGSSDSEQAL